MSGSIRSRVVPVALAVVLSAAILGGCASPKTSSQQLSPVVSPPTVNQAGVLRIGIDLASPPFGGTDLGKQAGIDMDVAAALANKLGLALVVVDVKASDAATALADGRVDAVMSVPFSQVTVGRVSIAGTYISDGSGLFTTSDSTMSVTASQTAEILPITTKLGAQKESAAYWELVSQVGTTTVTTYSTLREALVALSGHQIDAVCGDALIGTYIGRDLGEIRFAGQIAPAHVLGVAVGSKNTVLGDAIRKALDALAGDGVLSTVRRKWVGDLPTLSIPVSSETTTLSASTK
ncbi:MAG: transporter substrate-binding domain-containing protein [Coriobacteriia bacterium]|nr:transporter substrate-binding domain-containing protein [Coriobacteriia bacterium]